MINVLKETPEYTVCIKPVGISSEEGGMVSLLKEERHSDIYPVHRIDQAVSGIMVYARTAEAATSISKTLENKSYLCVIPDVLKDEEGDMQDWLYHDKRSNKSYPVKREKKNAKEALLSYRILEHKDGLALVSVTLKTGRTHQIRVQFASRKAPLYGDGKYGSRIKGTIALLSCRLSFKDPKTRENLTFEFLPGDAKEPFSRFDFFQKKSIIEIPD